MIAQNQVSSYNPLNILSPSKQKVHRCCKLSRYHSVYDFAAIYGVLMHFNLGQLCRFISLFLHLSNVHNHFHGNSDGCQPGVGGAAAVLEI